MKKKIMFFAALFIGSFSLTSATLPVLTGPIIIDSPKADSTMTEDLSEYCKPDWSGYDTLSPDISTRPFLHPTKKEKRKARKKARLERRGGDANK